MTRESNWNALDGYRESLHTSDVVNARELKYCEGCGALIVRLQGSLAQFCPDCKATVPVAARRMQ